jgi:hypothetical protein
VLWRCHIQVLSSDFYTFSRLSWKVSYSISTSLLSTSWSSSQDYLDWDQADGKMSLPLVHNALEQSFFSWYKGWSEKPSCAQALWWPCSKDCSLECAKSNLWETSWGNLYSCRTFASRRLSLTRLGEILFDARSQRRHHWHSYDIECIFWQALPAWTRLVFYISGRSHAWNWAWCLEICDDSPVADFGIGRPKSPSWTWPKVSFNSGSRYSR